jgi:hypothetical protein
MTDQIPIAPTRPERRKAVCEWKHVAVDGHWQTTCGQAPMHYFPHAEGWHWCPFCGKSMEQKT